MTRRTNRVNGLLQQELSYIVLHELKDPRLSKLVSITHVDISVDLRYAKIFVSVLGGQEEKDAAVRGLNSASGFIRKELRGRLSLKYIPELRFILDDSIEQADHVLRLIDSLSSRGSTKRVSSE